MAAFNTVTKEVGIVSLIGISGYYNEDGGRELRRTVEGILRSGKNRIVVNFANCTGINSPGVAVMIELAVLITEDFRGKMVLCGLDELKKKVFNLAGILGLAQVAVGETQAAEVAGAE